DRVCERVEEPRALGRRRLSPWASECRACCFDRAVDVCLRGDRDTSQGCAGRRLGELTHLARGGLGNLAVDEEPVLAIGRYGHRRGRYRPRRFGDAGRARLASPLCAIWRALGADTRRFSPLRSLWGGGWARISNGRRRGEPGFRPTAFG